jgi:hypothetical protein
MTRSIIEDALNIITEKPDTVTLVYAGKKKYSDSLKNKVMVKGMGYRLMSLENPEVAHTFKE